MSVSEDRFSSFDLPPSPVTALPNYVESTKASKRLFSRLDINRDGYITEEDIKVVMRSLQIYPRIQQIKDMIMEVDADGDQKINMKDFLDMRADNRPYELNVVATFKKFDVDKIHRGFLTDRSIIQVLTEENLSPEEVCGITEYLMKADVNRDRKVSYQNLHDLLTQEIPSAWKNWVRACLSRGVDKQSLIRTLEENGMSDEMIPRIFAEASSPRKRDDTDSFASGSSRMYFVRS